MARISESGTKTGKSGSREKRLAAALRENLRRRKAQARDRAAAAPPADSGAAAKNREGG